jgi:hypothetical protein
MLYDEMQEDVKRWTAATFADHELTVLSRPTEEFPHAPEVCRCAKPGTGVYSFVVSASPGVICVWGDIGEWVIRHSGGAGWAWLRGAVDSPSYLAQKIRAGEKDQFISAEARQLLREWEDDPENSPYSRQTLEQALSDFEFWDGSEYVWHQVWSDLGEEEPHCCRYPTSGVLWLIEAFKTLLRLYPQVTGV